MGVTSIGTAADSKILRISEDTGVGSGAGLGMTGTTSAGTETGAESVGAGAGASSVGVGGVGVGAVGIGVKAESAGGSTGELGAGGVVVAVSAGVAGAASAGGVVEALEDALPSVWPTVSAGAEGVATASRGGVAGVAGLSIFIPATSVIPAVSGSTRLATTIQSKVALLIPPLNSLAVNPTASFLLTYIPLASPEVSVTVTLSGWVLSIISWVAASKSTRTSPAINCEELEKTNSAVGDWRPYIFFSPTDVERWLTK